MHAIRVLGAAAALALSLTALAGCSSAAVSTTTSAPANTTPAAGPAPTASSPASTPAKRPGGCDWLTVEQVTAALGTNVPAIRPGLQDDVEIADFPGVFINTCRMYQKAFEGLEMSETTFPDAAATEQWRATISEGNCEPLSELGATAQYCQGVGYAMGSGDAVWGKSVIVVMGTRLRVLEWTRVGGDASALDIKAPMIALYQQTQFPA